MDNNKKHNSRACSRGCSRVCGEHGMMTFQIIGLYVAIGCYYVSEGAHFIGDSIVHFFDQSQSSQTPQQEFKKND